MLVTAKMHYFIFGVALIYPSNKKIFQDYYSISNHPLIQNVHVVCGGVN